MARRGRWASAVVFAVVLAVSIAVAWIVGGPYLAGAIAAILTPLPIVWQVFRWAREPGAAVTSTPAQIDDAARRLARLVEDQWRCEALVRQLSDPAPLAVRWKPAAADLGDHSWLAGTLSGRADEVRRMVDDFGRLPHRRLVVLGGPGAGKTTLVVLLTLALCERRGEDEPVPVLLAPGSWNPAQESLRAWIERRIAEEYPALRAAAFGPAAIEGLLAARRVLPVVDGLDELPESTAREALARIRQALGEGDPLVVTCRTDEYRSIMSATDVITAAAVIEAQAVDRGDILAYLAQVVPPGERSRRWRPLLDVLAHDPDGPLAGALSSPLTVSMLRTVYVDAGADPAELVDHDRFPDRASIESHLLDALVPTLIALTGPDATGRARARDPEASRRWLTFLATHLDRLGTRDLRWWHLYRHLPAAAWRLVLASSFGLVVGLPVGLVFGWFGFEAGLVSGIVSGIAAGLRAAAGLGAEPARASWRLRGRERSLVRQLVLGLLVGLGGMLGGPFLGLIGGGLVGWARGRGGRRLPGRRRSLVRQIGGGMVAGMVVGIMGQVGTVLALVFGAVLVFGIGLGFPNGFVVGLLAVMGFGIVVGLGFGLMGWLQVPSPDDRGATPRSTVEGSRALVLAVQSTCAAGGLLMLGTWVGIGTGIHAGVGRGIVVGMAVGLVPGLAYGIVGGLVSRLLPGAWIPFSIVRSWLALRGHLPWRLLAFLDDCHRLGILRQVGPVHQFRHARLQQHLARTPVPPPEPS